MMESNGIQFNSSRPVCLITGASRGIGKAIAKAFANAGYDLVLTCSKTLSELKAFARELETHSQNPAASSPEPARTAKFTSSML